MPMGSHPRFNPQPSLTAGVADGAIGSAEWRTAHIREWLLLLLRFAITHDPGDQAAVLSVASEIDSLGLQRRQWRRASFAGRAVRSATRSPRPTIRSEMPFSPSISLASTTF